MRMSERNKRDLWLSKPSLVELVDHEGRGTREYASVWSDPVLVRANVSATSGDSSASPFGTSFDYDLSVVMGSNDACVEEGDVMWAFEAPARSQDGQPSMDGAYDVRRVSEHLGHVSVALRRREGR